MMFLTFALLGMLQMNRISNRGAMDTQFELLAQCLAQEPIEIFQHLGYAWLDGVKNGKVTGLPAYPLDGSVKTLGDDPQAGVQYPVDAVHLQRRIELEPLENAGVKGYKVIVTILPKEGGAAAVWLSRNQVRMEALIVEQ